MALVFAQLRGLLPVFALIAAITGPNARADAEDMPTYDPRVEHALTLLEGSAATTQLRGVLDNNHVGVRFLPKASTGSCARRTTSSARTDELSAISYQLSAIRRRLTADC